MTNPLLARFIPEARELIASSSSGLLRLEKSPSDADAVNEVFRAVHTLKGSSGLFDVPALTRLVHVAEDLLGAIRVEQLILDSNLVDQLLATLDQVGIWIDQMEDSERLSEDADGISSSMAKSLRSYFSAVDQSAIAPPQEPAAASAADADRRREWLCLFSEGERLEAFSRIAERGGVLVHYRPAEDCFFNGTDPLNLMLNAPGLLSLAVEPVSPFPPPMDLDPYLSNLSFVMLAAGSPKEIEHHLRYELEHVVVAALRPSDLIMVSGATSDAPVWGDFREQAHLLLTAGDLLGIRPRIRTMLELVAPDLAAASALRWLDALLERSTPAPGLIAALIDATRSGVFVDPPPDAALPDRKVPPARALTLARDILAVQKRGLDGQAFDEDKLRTAAGALGRLAQSLHHGNMDAAIAVAIESALSSQSFSPLSVVLDRLDAALAQESMRATAAPSDGSNREARDGIAEMVPVAIASNGGLDHVDGGRGAAKLLKVDQAKIDLLMNLIGELVVSKNSLSFLAKRAEDVYKCRELGRELKDKYAVIDRLSQEMQSAIMQVRMLPVSDVFDRFHRVVRDVSRKLEKEIDLAIEGGDTAADKTIIEALGDPLLHIVRNSLDHGVELPAQRLAAGKPPRATITLRAYQEADQVVIEVGDDGRGIDPTRIRDVAVAKGVINRGEANALSDQEAINLVFRPGFSTAAEVSDLSGRGVGMDVVRTVVEKLGGRVTMTSRVGEGSQTRLMLPLSMAVTRVMLVEAAGGLYGVPMDLIVETVRVAADRIHTVKQAEVFVLREQLIPLVRMSTLLKAAARPHSPDEAEAVLVCRVDGRLVGLVIDEFRVGMDVVLKPLEGIVAGLRGFAGTTLLGDGRVLLVLDLKEFL